MSFIKIALINKEKKNNLINSTLAGGAMGTLYGVANNAAINRKHKANPKMTKRFEEMADDAFDQLKNVFKSKQNDGHLKSFLRSNFANFLNTDAASSATKNGIKKVLHTGYEKASRRAAKQTSSSLYRIGKKGLMGASLGTLGAILYNEMPSSSHNSKVRVGRMPQGRNYSPK